MFCMQIDRVFVCIWNCLSFVGEFIFRIHVYFVLCRLQVGCVVLVGRSLCWYIVFHIHCV